MSHKFLFIRSCCALLGLCALLALLPGCGAQGDGASSDAPVETMAAETTTQAPPTETTVPQVTGVGYCTADSMNVRGGPGTDYYAIGGLKYGEQVEILGREGDWYRISFKEGDGYVSAQYIQSSPPPEGGPVTTPESTAVTTGAAE